MASATELCLCRSVMSARRDAQQMTIDNRNRYAMQTLHFKPFSKEQLMEGLYKKFPHRKIQTNLGTLQVRTSGFTLSGNVVLNINPGKGIITTKTNLDMLVVYLLFLLPIGIYMLAKKDKTVALEREVVAGLKEILDPA